MSTMNKLSMATVAAAVLTLGIGNTAQAFTFFTNPENGHKYFLTTPDTWIGAQTQAVTVGGNLVTINDAAEQAWLTSTFGINQGFWIGLNDIEIEGQFKWISGQPITYTNWLSGEPNNFPHIPEGEDFVTMFGIIGNWADTTINLINLPPTIISGIVEFEESSTSEPTSVPEPTSALSILALGIFGVGSLLKRKQKVLNSVVID